MPIKKSGDKYSVVDGSGKTIKSGFKSKKSAGRFEKTYKNMKSKKKS